MPTEIICAIIAVAGAVVSSLIAWFVSRSTANKEIEKMQLSWAREDVVTSDDEFASMAASVANYVTVIQQGYGSDPRDTIANVASVRSRESGALAAALDELYETLRSTRDTNAINTALTCVINEKRKCKGTQSSPN